MRSAEEIESQHALWADNADDSLKEELSEMEGDDSAMADAFFQDLEFGTAGLRGVIGAGSNRMNIHTVGRATQGLADYLNSERPVDPADAELCAKAVGDRPAPTVAICRDSRNMGEEFVRVTAGVLAANGIRSFVYPRVEPTPALSFAVRDLRCSAGINITASHNPAAYNGYKAYGPDGCQITSEAATAISRAISKVDIFDGVRCMDFDEAMASGLIEWIGEDTLKRFIDAVVAQSVESDPADADLSVVYTPLNGVGLECVVEVLRRIGIADVALVPEQAKPDGNFPTCPYPNPEFREALERGLALCETERPDILLATDPDADRVGAAVLHDGEYRLISGNEMGALMLDYICEMRTMRGEDLSRDVAVTTIVSTAMVDAMAAERGFELRRTLTGFKYIGEQILGLEIAGEADRFIFGFEESYGYMSGGHVRDKDAVNASMIICQMARWHKSHGRDLIDALADLHARYGFYLNRTINVSYPGAEGVARMSQIMDGLRSDPPSNIAGMDVVSFVDYSDCVIMPRVNGSDEAQRLPAADVVEFAMEGDGKLIIRPSGTEPKIKGYLFARAETEAAAQGLIDSLETATRTILGDIG